MSLLNNLFGGKIDSDGAFKDIASKVDDSKFTLEEQSRFEMAKADKQAEFYEKSKDENTIRSKSRRFATYLVLINFFVSFWMVVALYIYGKTEAAIFVKDLAVEWKLVAAFFAVIVFFFSGYYVMKSIEKFKKK